MKNFFENSEYVFDPQRQTWSRPDYGGIAYNDGDEIEQRIAKIVEQASDLSVLSSELRQHCTDWPSLYHLSGTRANILRPFSDSLQGDILEIGAGCGAITRYLGEIGANVLALEGSPRRAAIARARTSDLGNVTVLAEKFDKFKCAHKFDAITLIGVLEYANLFTPSANPALSMLEHVCSLLKPDGKLIIAIENQLGLKYFAGAPEDHLGQPMYGIEGRYRKDQPQTFGREVLAGLLKQAGFSASEFLAPFPDYKLPVSILTEKGIQNENFDASALAWQSVRRDPQLPPHCSFSLELAWPAIFKNGIALDVANSFLVIASPQGQRFSDQKPQALAYHYSTDRIPRYCKETRFEITQADGVQVVYKRLHAVKENREDDEGNVILFTCSEKEKYSLGTPLSWKFIQIVTRDGWKIEEVGEFLRRYIEVIAYFLEQEGLNPIALSLPSEARLPGKFFDLLPQNIIIRAGGEPIAIDTEWSLREEIAVEQLLFRSMLWMVGSITRFGHTASGHVYSRGEFIEAAFRTIEFDLDEKKFSYFMDLESKVQKQVTGRSAKDFLAWWPGQSLPKHNLIQIVAEHENQITHLHQSLTERENQITGLNEALSVREKQGPGVQQIVTDLHTKIAAIHELVAARDAQYSLTHSLLEERNTQIASLQQAIIEREAQVAHANSQVAALCNSTSWRMTLPLRISIHQVKKLRRVAQLAGPSIKQGGGLKNTLAKAVKLYRREGIEGIKRGFRLVAGAGNLALNPDGSDRNNYGEWLLQYDTITEEMRVAMLQRIHSFRHKPLISVVMPTFNPKVEWLVEAIESVRRQIYPHWELCIADDASTDQAVRSTLEEYARKDLRIKVVFRQQNGHISEASNSALEVASGEWVALLDHDDLLSEHALFWVAGAIDKAPDLRMIYSDEDKIDAGGKRFDPYFKCEWNPDLFFSHNMFSHLGVYDAALLREIGGFRKGLEGSQDYDLALRCIERVESSQIHHIPRVLYHWRTHEGSTAHSGEAKPYALVAGERALNEHFQRVNVKATATSTEYGYRVEYALPEVPPLVSLIIPTRNGLHLIRTCVESILKKTTYPNYEILIVDNGSDEPATLDYLEGLKPDGRVRIIRDDRPFNYSALNNGAAKLARGDLLGLLNNDLEIISPDWLSEMVSHAMRPEIGAVGARLWYPNDTLQHGGVLLGVGGVANHAHLKIGRGRHGYFSRASLIQSFSAVTAACLLVRKELYEKVGGLNETDLQVAFNDVDFCLRIREAGYRNVWTPYAELYHHESATRGLDDNPVKRARFVSEVQYMMQRWGSLLTNDPAYSPNLTLEHSDFSLSWPPRVERL